MSACQGSLLLTGAYGVGKSTVTAELGTTFERASVPYAVLDLDWLGWFDVGWDDDEAQFGLMLKNLDAVVTNYVEAGVRYLVMALTIEHQWQLDSLRVVVPAPLQVVQLEVPLATIEARLSSDPTSGRQDDLARATQSIASGSGQGLADHTLNGDRPVDEIVSEVLDVSGWSLDA